MRVIIAHIYRAHKRDVHDAKLLYKFYCLTLRVIRSLNSLWCNCVRTFKMMRKKYYKFNYLDCNKFIYARDMRLIFSTLSSKERARIKELFAGQHIYQPWPSDNSIKSLVLCAARAIINMKNVDVIKIGFINASCAIVHI